VAYLVTSNGDAPSTTDLRAFLRESLPEYMVPSRFVYLDSLPLTPNGKVDRQALPAPSREASGGDGEATPRTETERAVAAIWSELLKVDGIGIHDDFFDLGGDSMTAIVLIVRLQSDFSVDLELPILFDRPTIAGLSEAIDMLAVTNLGFDPGTGPAEREEFEL
jgi:acyl carrier protein